MANKGKYSLFYKNEILNIYKIIINDNIEDKDAEILKLGTIKKLRVSLETGMYTGIEEELRVVKEWFYKNLGVDKRINKNKEKGNQYSEKNILRKLSDLVYLNRLYTNELLNINTYYPIFKKISKSKIDSAPSFKHLLVSKYITFDDPEIKEAFQNIDEIEKTISQFHKGISFENLKYRRSIEEFLEKNNYLENYKYAEYILKTYIDDESCYKISEIIAGFDISIDHFKECLKIIKFLNPVLYEQYIEKKKRDSEKNIVACNYAFINLANSIRESRKNGQEFDKYEFIRKAPFLKYSSLSHDIHYDYAGKLRDFIHEPGVLKTLSDYVYRTGLNHIVLTNVKNYLNNFRAINGHILTPEEKQDIYKIIKDLNIAPFAFAINEVIRKYLNNEYDMESIELSKRMADKSGTLKNPYTYTIRK